MKRILAFALPLAMLFATQSCEKREVATHNMQWDNTGNDSIVRVQGQDENGNMMTYFLAYTLFNNLFSRGGYTAVNNYYQHNRASIDRDYGRYHQNYTNTTSPKSAINLTKDSHGNVNTSNAYRKSSPTYSNKQTQTAYKKSSPTYNKPTTTYRTSSPTYKSSAPSSSYRTSSPTYKSSSSSSSSYRSSSPSYKSSSSSSSSYRSSSPSYRSSSSYSSSSSSYRSSSSPGRR